jgi:hypothetical protein
VKISGFSFARNADTYYFPVAESIRSILPVCDEFVVAVGKGDDGDRTRELIEAIGSPKIRIIDTQWPEGGPAADHLYKQQTDIALRECSGDWCFYLQSDEAIHEKRLPYLAEVCRNRLDDKRVDGFLFDYRHFWGDYDHYHVNHRWYARDIRIIRNRAGISSYKDAQSFRRNGEKLHVVKINAEVFHYGWVRPPRIMRNKQIEMCDHYKGKETGRKRFNGMGDAFDYGSLEKLARFKGTHPESMKEWIAKMDWKDRLQQSGKQRVKFKHDRLKYRILTFIEQRILGGRRTGYRNWKIIGKDEGKR